MSDDRHEAVSRRAYELWEKEGGAHGRHEDHWHQASTEVTGTGVTGNPAAPDGTTMDAPGTGAAPVTKTAAKRAPKAAAPAAPAPAAKPRKPKTTK